MEEHPCIGLLVIGFIILINAFLSAAMSALKNVSEANLEKRLGDGDERAGRLIKLVENEGRYIDAVETCMSVLVIIIGILFADSYFDSLYHELRLALEATGVAEYSVLISGAISVLAVIVLIYVVVLFGKVIPDKLVKKKADERIDKYYGILKLAATLIMPLCGLIRKSAGLVLKLAGLNINELDDNVTEEEIISIVNEGQEQGVLEAEEAEMISNIINFDEKQTRDIMTHRTKIVAVNSELQIEEAMQFMAGESFSRFPLYTGDIDNIVGLIHLKDVIKCYSTGDYKRKKLIDIARKPVFVPDTQNIDDLFREMQMKKNHIAIVVDEYGQTAGIVAMEDILEEIVGNIQDEFDKEEELIKAWADGSFLVNGEAPLSEVAEKTGINPDEEDLENFDTLNGLIISLLGRIPADGEVETIDYCGYRLEVLETRKKMIQKVRISKLPEKEAEDDSADDKDAS